MYLVESLTRCLKLDDLQTLQAPRLLDPDYAINSNQTGL